MQGRISRGGGIVSYDDWKTTEPDTDQSEHCQQCGSPQYRCSCEEEEPYSVLELLQRYRAQHGECQDLTGHPDALKSQCRDWRCSLCRQADEVLTPPLKTGRA